MNPNPRPLCLSCSIFRKEIEALQASGRLDLPVEFLNSMLHMVPAKLESRLGETLAAVRSQNPQLPVVIAYGDCCGHMETFESAPGTSRTDGINCCEIILGRDTYRKLRREGAFFLMPEWALSWKQVFVGQLGLLGPCAKTFMQEMHTRLVYLDTGILPVPHQHLEEASEFLGLPVEVLPVSLDPLLASLNQALQAARRPDAD
jgi:hypothetical protein